MQIISVIVQAILTNIQAISTVILTIITGYYAFQTYRLVNLNEKMVESQIRPYISITPYTWDCIVALLIKNLGKSAAQNVRFSLDKDVPQFDGKKKLNEFNLFKDPIASFPSGAEYHVDIAQSFVILNPANKFPTQFTIRCNYEFHGKPHQEDYCIDLKSYDNTSYPRNALVDEIKKFREELLKKLK